MLAPFLMPENCYNGFIILIYRQKTFSQNGPIELPENGFYLHIREIIKWRLI